MEGQQLCFFITHKERSDVILLSEYDTVEHLKIEIDNKFHVPIAYQDITGWQSTPEGDDSILQVCSKPNDVNRLTVRNNSVDGQMDIDTDRSNTGFMEMELQAIRRFVEKVPESRFMNLHTSCFEDAVSHVITGFEKKALMIYLHNPEDVLSQQFLTYIQDEKIADILNDSFLVIAWDIKDDSSHRALSSALKPYTSLSIINHYISEKTAALFCLLPDSKELMVPDSKELVIFFCLRGNVALTNLLQNFTNVKMQLHLSDIHCENASYPMEKQGEKFQEYEIEAIKSFKRKLSTNTSVTFRHCTLDDAISFICTAPFDERKALLLYLHNSESEFSKIFSENLVNGELVQILNKSFLVLGWDVDQTKYHDALVSALSHHVSLSLVSDLVTNKISVGLCILPISGTINVFSCLRDKISVKEIIKTLKQVETVFNEEIEKERELQKIEQEKGNENDLGSEKLHSIWADMLGDRDYDRFEFDQHTYLKDKIGFALKGPPQKESGYEEKTKAQIEELYDIIKNESNEIAEFKDQIEISFIYNCLEPLPDEKIQRSKEYEDYNPQTDVNPVPIFVLRKCQGSDNPCRIFIDNGGRVYQSWEDYLTHNKFHKCDMIVPLNGRYVVKDEKVLLEKHLSPACHLDARLLQVGDIVSTAAGLVSGGIFIAAAIPAIPVAAPLVIGAGVVGVGAGIWAIGRSIHTLWDRQTHKESMSFTNSEARGAYLNIVAGSLGFVGAGANMALTQLVKSGANIGQGATYFVNTIGIMNIGAGGASLVNSGYEVFDQWYNEDRAPSALTILQLSTSVLFFGHAVYNFKGAQTIIDETQARVLQDYQDSLRSNRHRKTFNKMMKETLRNHGDGTRGKAEVISAIRNIQNKDEVFAALTRNNKAMNRAGIKFSADGGQIKLGGLAVDMNEFIGLNKKQTETFLNSLTKQNTSQQSVPVNTTTSNNNISIKAAVKDLLSEMNIEVSGSNLQNLVSLTMQLLMFCSGDVKTKVINAVRQAIEYVLTKLAGPIVEQIDGILPKNLQFSKFLRLGISFFSRKVDELERQYQIFERTRDQKYYNPLFDQVNPLYVKRTVMFFEFVVRNSYSGITLSRAVLNEISGFITAWISRLIFENEERKKCEQRRIIHSAGYRAVRINCPKCGGYYFKHN